MCLSYLCLKTYMYCCICRYKYNGHLYYDYNLCNYNHYINIIYLCYIMLNIFINKMPVILYILFCGCCKTFNNSLWLFCHFKKTLQQKLFLYNVTFNGCMVFLPVTRLNHYLVLVVLFGTYTKSLVLLCLKAGLDENDLVLTSHLSMG